MDEQGVQMPEQHRAVVERFVAACATDERVVAAFLGGSYAAGRADAYSDLDLNVITTDDTYDDVLAGREALVAQLGEPIFLELYHDHEADSVFFMLADGTEGEIGLARQRHFTHIHSGPFLVLVDKQGVLDGVQFPMPSVEQGEQTETLRRLIWWFWHDLRHHFVTPLARGQLWSAFGGLEDLRRTCIDLARLREDFAEYTGAYEKVEQAVPDERLASLRASICPLERDAMLQAARVVVAYYEELAPGLAQTHGVAYPTALARLMSERLEQLSER